MRLSRLVLGLGAALLVAGGLVIVEAGPAAAATCALPAPVGGVITLTADCDTTIPLVIPDGVTLDGAGHSITAHDPVGGFFSGAVVTNAGTSMIIQNLTIVGSFPTAAPGCGRGILEGIRFNDAGGSVSNVTVDGITEGSGCNPTTGIGIRAEGVAAARTVTITNTTVTGYQRNGMDARGTMTMNVSGSTIGPPQDLNNIIGQNGVVYFQSAAGQPGGTVSGNTIFGNGDAVQNVSTTAVLLAGAKDVTITQNTITSDPSQKGTDVGIFVFNGSTGVTISSNNITRANADDPDPDGVGVVVCSDNSPPVVKVCGSVDTASSATLICNTYSGWNTNIVGATEEPCPTTTTASTTTTTTPGSGVGAGTVTRTEPLARTGRSSTPLVTTGLLSLITGIALVLAANGKRSRLRKRPSNPA